MSWEKYEKSADKGPMGFTLRVIFFFVVIAIVLSVIGAIFGWFGEAAQVARQEFGPRAGLEKYEWFLEQASAIEKMDEDIRIFEARIDDVAAQYQGYGDDMSKWPPHIQVQYNKERQNARDDLVAIISQRNNLVKEYNAASEKFNWSPFKTELDKPRERFEEYHLR